MYVAWGLQMRYLCRKLSHSERNDDDKKSQNDANQSAEARAKADLRRSRRRAGNGAVFNEYNL